MLRVQRLPDGIIDFVIDHPPVNAFSLGLMHQLAEALETMTADPAARVVVIRADGRGFCAGGDVKEVEALAGFGGILGQAQTSLRLILAVLNCAVPVIVALHGHCVGVGVLLAGAADIVIAAEGTQLVLAEIDNGATAGGVLALRLMPEKRVRAAMMTAAPIRAEELHGYGTIFEIVGRSDLAAAALTLAGTLAAKGAEPMRRLKRSLYNSTRSAGVESAYRAELSYTYELNMIGAASEGRRAFLSGTRESYLAAGTAAVDK
jgi:enoyl-CoA hydratase